MLFVILAGQRLREEADLASVQRWHLARDMNGDGVVTISDVQLWLSWLFFAPGDFLLLVVMKYLPAVAAFLELTPKSLSGSLSGIRSAIAWILIFVTVNVATQGPRMPRPPPAH